MTDEQKGGFIERLRNSPRTVSTIIVILIIAGAVFAFSDRKSTNQTASSPEPSAEEPQASNEAKAKDEGKKPEQKGQVKAEATPMPQAKETAEAYEEVAQRGQGTTNLARLAIKRYLDANPSEKISNEQKIYAEDYLKDQLNRKKLGVGETVAFSKDMVKKSVESSKGLSDAQLKNLQKYARRVNW